MAESKKIVIRVAGRTYKVKGAESEEQLRLIESCVNEKIKALHKLFSVQNLDEETILMLTAINLADDYLKADQQLQALKTRVDKLTKKEKQLQEAVDRYEEDLMNLETENQEYAERLKKTQKSPEA